MHPDCLHMTHRWHEELHLPQTVRGRWDSVPAAHWHCQRSYLERVRKDNLQKKLQDLHVNLEEPCLRTTPWRKNNRGHHTRNNEVYLKKFRLKNDLGDVSCLTMSRKGCYPPNVKAHKDKSLWTTFLPFFTLDRWWQEMNSTLTFLGFQDKQSRSTGCREPAHLSTMNMIAISSSMMLHMEHHKLTLEDFLEELTLEDFVEETLHFPHDPRKVL